MGNRGCLHGQGRELGVARWRSTLWICCVLEWKGYRRDPMPPGRWTALFFADEATALAAGHRPCAYCRRSDYLDFAEAWRVSRGLPQRQLAKEIDAVLHGERVDRVRRKVTYQAPMHALPDGVMVRHQGTTGLVVAGRLRPWSFDGYAAPPARGSAGGVADEVARDSTSGVAGEVTVLTPPSIVAAIAAGYRPLVHPSALTGTGLADGAAPSLRAHESGSDLSR